MCTVFTHKSFGSGCSAFPPNTAGSLHLLFNPCTFLSLPIFFHGYPVCTSATVSRWLLAASPHEKSQAYSVHSVSIQFAHELCAKCIIQLLMLPYLWTGRDVLTVHTLEQPRLGLMLLLHVIVIYAYRRLAFGVSCTQGLTNLQYTVGPLYKGHSE